MYHRIHMRRGFSILLMLLFGLGPLSAILKSSENQTLPACCRRSGAHHCAMSALMGATDQAASGSSATLTAPATCPLFPGFMAGPAAPAHALTASQPDLPTPHLQVLTFVHGRLNIHLTPVHTHAGRGPPALSQI